MRTLFTYVGSAAASALLLASMALLPVGRVQSAPQRPLALTQTAEPPTPTPVVATPTPPERPTLPPTETPTAIVTAQPTAPPSDDSGGDAGVADPYITKRANLDAVQVGDFVEFTLTVGNTGSAAATDVVVTDPIPGFLTIYNATTTRGLISVSGNTVTIEIGAVEPGELITIVILTRVNQQVAPPDNRNTATLSTTSAGDDPSNNASSAALITSAAPTATPTPSSVPTAPPAEPGAGSPTATPVPPAATSAPSAPPASPVPTAASPAVVLPPTGADASVAQLLIVSLLLLALGAGVVSAVVRRRSLR
jgi:uncharacterized repeat protein (TIGR01451 family)